MSVTEEDVKQLFVEEYNKLDVSKAIKNAKNVISKITKTDTYEKMLKDANETAQSFVNQIKDLIDKNARVVMNQDEFNKEKERLSNLYNYEKENIDKYTKEIEGRKARRVILETFITNIENAHKIKEFDEDLFCVLVDKILVFKDKMEIRWRGIS